MALLLIVAPNERKTRIEVGYGLEPYLTDGLSALIIQNQMLPRFREGDYPGGIVDATDTSSSNWNCRKKKRGRCRAGRPERAQRDGGFPIGALIWIAFIFLFFILPMLGGARRRGAASVAAALAARSAISSCGKRPARLRAAHRAGRRSSAAAAALAAAVSEAAFLGGGGSFGGGGASGGW